MEFKREELIEREIEIAGYLVQDFSLRHISGTTSISKRLLAAHVRNMMKKLAAEDMPELRRLLKVKFG